MTQQEKFNDLWGRYLKAYKIVRNQEYRSYKPVVFKRGLIYNWIRKPQTLELLESTVNRFEPKAEYILNTTPEQRQRDRERPDLQEEYDNLLEKIKEKGFQIVEGKLVDNEDLIKQREIRENEKVIAIEVCFAEYNGNKHHGTCYYNVNRSIQIIEKPKLWHILCAFGASVDEYLPELNFEYNDLEECYNCDIDHFKGLDFDFKDMIQEVLDSENPKEQFMQAYRDMHNYRKEVSYGFNIDNCEKSSIWVKYRERKSFEEFKTFSGTYSDDDIYALLTDQL